MIHPPPSLMQALFVGFCQPKKSQARDSNLLASWKHLKLLEHLPHTIYIYIYVIVKYMSVCIMHSQCYKISPIPPPKKKKEITKHLPLCSPFVGLSPVKKCSSVKTRSRLDFNHSQAAVIRSSRLLVPVGPNKSSSSFDSTRKFFSNQ